jgi:chromosome segregation ATPase
MSQHDGIDGLSVERTVDDVVAADETRDPEEVRSVLADVTDGDVVTAEAFDEAVSDVSKVVSTAETRTELAGIALDDTEETAERVADVDAVARRLDEFEADWEAVSARAAALTDDLQSAIDDPDDAESLYETVAALRDVASDAQSVQSDADHLSVALEDFERWVADPSLRVDELDGDADAVARSVETLMDAVDRLESALEGDEPPAGTDPALAWFDTTLRHRVTALLAADVRAELADVRTLADRQGVEADVDGVADRLADVEARLDRVAATLDDLERTAWREAYGDRIDAFESELDAFEPPVSWGAVQETLADYRPETGGA